MLTYSYGCHLSIKPEDVHITFSTTCSVEKVVFAPRIMDAKNVFLMNNIKHHVHQYVSASSVTGIKDLYLKYNMNGRVGRLISTLNITNVHGSVYIVYNITAPVDLLVTDLTVVNVQGSVYIHFNVSSHINKHVSLLMTTNVEGDIYINFDGLRTSECFSIPSNWLSELQTSLSDKSSLCQRIREAASCNNPGAPLKVYMECLEMERKFLATLGIIEDVQARKSRHDGLLKESHIYLQPWAASDLDYDIYELEGPIDFNKKCAIEIRVEHSERGEERGEPEEVDEKQTFTLDINTYGEVHRFNRPVRSCKSCACITYDTRWNLLEPSVSTETGVLVYKHRSPPGRHECTVSGLCWACAGEVTLQYCLADPDIFQAELPTLQYTPIGPLMDIRVLSGELDEAHLPHSACLERSDSSFSDAVRVLPGDDSGVSLEKCAQLSCLHAKLRHPSFSLVGLLVKMGIPVWSLVDV
ncbi:uncharacterized protein LOC143125728 isoform X2 [Alosa pseudoharengus]|uniref:uncharacterized protein LOC143125728 isoform X2 n=1 Tax=Alosa pseudoharengus TaxID=34774 RepID=UPI003F8B6D80